MDVGARLHRIQRVEVHHRRHAAEGEADGYAEETRRDRGADIRCPCIFRQARRGIRQRVDFLREGVFLFAVREVYAELDRIEDAGIDIVLG